MQNNTFSINVSSELPTNIDDNTLVIGTHSGIFHSDEVVAIALLILLNPGKRIETTIYSTKKLHNAIKDIKYDYLTSGSDSFVNYPMVCVKDNGERKIVVEETNSIKLEKDYLITIKGPNDEIFLRKVVNGSSLYSVYYNLMIEYRFFKNQENRISK